MSLATLPFVKNRENEEVAHFVRIFTTDEQFLLGHKRID